MRAEHCDRISEDVRHHESDAVALFDPLGAQPGRKRGGVTFDFREAHTFAEALIGRAFSEAAHALAVEIDNGAERLGDELFGNAGRVEAKPRAILIRSCRAGPGRSLGVAPIHNHRCGPKACSTPSLRRSGLSRNDPSTVLPMPGRPLRNVAPEYAPRP